jgi:membrane-associated phospholipid phosphatase
MRSLFTPLALALSLAWAVPAACAPAASAQPACATPAAEPDWTSVVGPYPHLGTLEGQSERFVLTWLQNSRLPGDVARALGEGTPSLGCYVAAIHLPPRAGDAGAAADGFRRISLADFPRTAAVLEQARQDFAPVLAGLKDLFARPRPYHLFQGLTPALPLPQSPSYPSSHAALGALYAKILGQLDPADQAGLDGAGKLLGTDRVLGGVHYPSDVDAGIRLGRAYAIWWLDQPGHLKLLQTACAEWR